MDADHPPHAPRPARGPLRHVLPRRRRKHEDPFLHAGDHRPLHGTANPGESRGADAWAAVKAGLVIVLLAALVTLAIILVSR